MIWRSAERKAQRMSKKKLQKEKKEKFQKKNLNDLAERFALLLRCEVAR